MKLGKSLLFALLASLSANSANAELNILSTIKPIYYLVEGVNQGINPHELMVSSSVSPHDYQPKPSDIRKNRNSDVIFRIHENFQPRLNKLLSANAANIPTFSLANLKPIRLLANEAHLNTEHQEDAHNMDEDHDEHGHNHDHGAYDLHIWLSPINAIILTQEIALQLSKLDKDNTAKYQYNAEQQISNLRKLDLSLQQKLAPLKNRNFFSYHDAYGYFTENFGLNHSIAVTPSQSHQLSAKKMQDILNLSKDKNITCVMLEPQFNDKISKIIVKKNPKTKVNSWDPLGFDLELEANSYYTLIKNMADKLTTCLS